MITVDKQRSIGYWMNTERDGSTYHKVAKVGPFFLTYAGGVRRPAGYDAPIAACGKVLMDMLGGHLSDSQIKGLSTDTWAFSTGCKGCIARVQKEG
jgi:hypothetical protein